MTRATMLTAGLLAAATMFGSCRNSDAAHRYYGAKTYPPKPVEEVEVLTTAPQRRFVVIADFQSRVDTEESFRKRAAQIGADAVIVTHVGGHYDRREEWAGEDRLKDRESAHAGHIVGTAIKYE